MPLFAHGCCLAPYTPTRNNGLYAPFAHREIVVGGDWGGKDPFPRGEIVLKLKFGFRCREVVAAAALLSFG